MKIKIDKADQIFSKYIRLRDKRCVRCQRPAGPDKDGFSISGIQVSHFFGRGRESTRFEPDNCDSLCMGCHRIWGSDDREAYREFKIEQLGQKRFDELTIQANTPKKKDREMAYLTFKKLLEGLKGTGNDN